MSDGQFWTNRPRCWMSLADKMVGIMQKSWDRLMLSDSRA